MNWKAVSKNEVSAVIRNRNFDFNLEFYVILIASRCEINNNFFHLHKTCISLRT